MPDNQLNILLVEDSVSDAKLLQEAILSGGGNSFSVSVTQSLREAISHIENNHVDVVLLDLSLPDSSGLETVLKLRQACADMPIVVLTGGDDEKTGVEAVRMGVQDYLVKGQTPARLITRSVRYAIERKMAQREREMTIEFLKLLNSTAVVDEVIKTSISFFKEKIGCDDVCIRLGDKDNESAKIIDHCRKQHYESIAIIPLQAGNDYIGLLRICDHRKYKFTADMIRLWEHLADDIAMVITKLRAEEALRQAEEVKKIEQEVILAVEQHQRQVGQDLHDSVQGSLTGISFMLEALKTLLCRGETESAEHIQEIDQIADAIRQAIGQTRAIAHGLNPVEIESGDLQTALNRLASDTTSFSNIDCSFACEGQIQSLDESVAAQIYYICQEAVNNAIKHSGAEHISISLESENRTLRISIADDGKGIPDNLPKGKGMGLSTMSCRARFIGASFAISPRPKGGTIVTCQL